jgi:hypothetical protein
MGRIYRESKLGFFDVEGVSVPVAVSVFPDEIYSAQRSWVEQAYPKLNSLQPVRQGRPLRSLGGAGVFSEEIRAAFKSLR